MDENNGTRQTRHLSSTNSGQPFQQGADLQHARDDPELTTTTRKSVIINEYESDKASPNDTILTTLDVRRRWSPAGREECDEFANRDGYQQDNVHKEVNVRTLTSNSSRTGLTSRARQTFSPIQNDSKVQETAKYRDEDEANKHRSQHAVETNDGSCSAKNSRVTQRSSEGCKGERASQTHQQQGNDAHDVSETRRRRSRDLRGRKQEIRGYRKARNLRLKHSTAPRCRPRD